jgi:uncharacterized protein (DUF433 family)
LGEGYLHDWTRARDQDLPVSWRWMPLAGDARWIAGPRAWGCGVPAIALEAERADDRWTWRIWETWDYPDNCMPLFWIREHGYACTDHVAAMRAAETRAAELSRDRHVVRRYGSKATIRDTDVAVGALLERLGSGAALPEVAAELGIDPADARRLLLQLEIVANRVAIEASDLPGPPPATARSGGWEGEP